MRIFPVFIVIFWQREMHDFFNDINSVIGFWTRAVVFRIENMHAILAFCE